MKCPQCNNEIILVNVERTQFKVFKIDNTIKKLVQEEDIAWLDNKYVYHCWNCNADVTNAVGYHLKFLNNEE
jgi:hypothetical protein